MSQVWKWPLCNSGGQVKDNLDTGAKSNGDHFNVRRCEQHTANIITEEWCAMASFGLMEDCAQTSVWSSAARPPIGGWNSHLFSTCLDLFTSVHLFTNVFICLHIYICLHMFISNCVCSFVYIWVVVIVSAHLHDSSRKCTGYKRENKLMTYL